MPVVAGRTTIGILSVVDASEGRYSPKHVQLASAFADLAALAIERDRVYPLDVFHAERHLIHSNFRIETSIDCFIVK